MGYSKLEKNLIDLMKEEQAKLGYRKEAVRLYYPLSSLNHLFDAEDSGCHAGEADTFPGGYDCEAWYAHGYA